MRSLLTLVVLLALQINCQADYWNSDFRLPRLKGVQKILVKETRWDDAPGKPRTAHVSRSVLWLNKNGLVVKEEDYGRYSWITGYNIYEYVGNDTIFTTIRCFVYPGMQVVGQKPAKKDYLVQTVEFVNEHSDPQHKDWLFYQLDSPGLKRLLNSTSTYYNQDHEEVYSLYKSFEAMRYTDSTVYHHSGDTLVSYGYTADAGKPYRLKGKEVVVKRRDALNRLIYADRIAGAYSGMLRKSDFIYDKNGQYLGERYEQECEQCKTGWQEGGDRRSYDASSRLKSVVYNVEGKPVLQYDLIYVK